VALPGAYAPASIALPVIGAHKPPLHDKAVVLEDIYIYIYKYIMYTRPLCDSHCKTLRGEER
jgi:hypothetical protein